MNPDRPRTIAACVALGSNLGDREAALGFALDSLRAMPGVAVVAVSRVYETDPVGPPPQGPYLNAAIALEVGLSARALLERLLAIEAEAGRTRSADPAQRNRARTLDLDLLLFGESCIDEPGLVVPHPRLHERAFVLEPLCDVAAERRHPVLGATIAELAAPVRDLRAVRCVGPMPGR